MKSKKITVSLRKGFTLIELLVVIAIIGILSALLMANFIGVRQRARDAQRKADMRQIQSAIELYRVDNQVYPTAVPNCTTSSGVPKIVDSSNSCTSPSTIYMQKVPYDPLLNSGSPVSYIYTTTAQTAYCVRACLENGSDSELDTKTTPGCATATGCAIASCNMPANNCPSGSYAYTVQSQ